MPDFIKCFENVDSTALGCSIVDFLNFVGEIQQPVRKRPQKNN